MNIKHEHEDLSSTNRSRNSKRFKRKQRRIVCATDHANLHTKYLPSYRKHHSRFINEQLTDSPVMSEKQKNKERKEGSRKRGETRGEAWGRGRNEGRGKQKGGGRRGWGGGLQWKIKVWRRV